MNSSQALAQSTPPPYYVEKWDAEDDDAFHAIGQPAPRVGRARMIMETKSFRSGGGTGWNWAGVFNALAIITLLGGIIGVFAGRGLASVSRAGG